jgi:hypothetical protein
MTEPSEERDFEDPYRRWKDRGIGAALVIAAVILVLVFVGQYSSKNKDPAAPAASADSSTLAQALPAPSVALTPSIAVPPSNADVMNPTTVALAPASPPYDTDTVSPDDVRHNYALPDGPAPDMPPYGIDAQAMLDEIRGHDVRVDDDKAVVLVTILNKNIARGDPDLNAWDEQITSQVEIAFPYFTKKNVTDVTRCLAEAVERNIARERHAVDPKIPAIPPDDLDDHGVEVKNPGYKDHN